MFPAAEFFYESPDVAVGDVIKDGELIPGADESYNHTARVCVVGPDKKLYIQLGQAFNVPPKAKVAPFKEAGIGGIIRVDQNGANREVYATGLRNPVGFDFNPTSGEFWTNDNQVDGMGDDIPPGELNRITAPGQEFGFPWYGGGHVRTNEFKDSEPPADVGLSGGGDDPARGRSWDGFLHRQQVPGEVQEGRLHRPARLLEPHRPRRRPCAVHPAKRRRHPGAQEEFASGWLTDNGEYIGRPVALTQLRDGSLLVSDDFAGASTASPTASDRFANRSPADLTMPNG